MSIIPYPGLRPFQKTETDLFFGREEHTDQLLEKLSQHRFISVVGLSGCGKSSLVRAGMIPALKSGYMATAGAYWHVIEMRPGNHPLQSLAEALLVDSTGKSELFGGPSQIDAVEVSQVITSQDPFALMEILHTHPLPKRTNFLLLVDQFEEIFRYHRQGNRNEAEAFVALLLNSAEQREVPIYVVTTMRSDFIGECAVFRGLPEMMNSCQFLVPRLTREQQRMAIIGPARVCSGDIEPRLVNRLLDEMGNAPDQLPLLQHCLMRLWYRAARQYAEGQAITMSLEDYESIGGVQQALSDHADEAFAELDEQDQRVAEVLFRCLSERGTDLRDTRRPVPISEVAGVAGVSVSEVIAVVNVFRRPDRCFLSPYGNTPLQSDSIIDISHESLIRQWQQLQQWVTDETNSAELYLSLVKEVEVQQKHGQMDLWSGFKLENALLWRKQKHPTPEWANRYGGNFDAVMHFLDTSRRKKLLRRIISSGFIIAITVAVIASVLATWAFKERSIANRALGEAETRRIEAEDAKKFAEVRRIEAEDARKFAETQSKRASQAEQAAKKAQKEAELNSDRFNVLVNATFGFLLESERNQEFLAWTEERAIAEQLQPALHLMIDLSERLSQEEKEFWHTVLPTLSQERKLDLFNLLGTEAAEKTQDEEEFQISRLFITDVQGILIPSVDDIYTIKAGEVVSIEVNVMKPQGHSIQITWRAYRGSVIAQNMSTCQYTAESAGVDIVIVRILMDTGETLEQPINISVIQ